jgi:hypothetical protein
MRFMWKNEKFEGLSLPEGIIIVSIVIICVFLLLIS